jgi:membrane-associated protease RseP (regulator of RpoE activity)
MLKNFPQMHGEFGDISKQMEQLQEHMRKAMEQGDFAARELPGFAARHFRTPPRLGVKVEKPSDILLDQLNLRRDQGLILTEVIPDSAAAKAGLKVHDVLIELNGKTVAADVAQFHKDVAAIKANTKVTAVVFRKGKRETISGLVLPEVKSVTKSSSLPAMPNFKPMVPGTLAAPNHPHARPAVPSGGQTSIVRNNDGFTARERNGDQTITVTGKVQGNKPIVTGIEVKNGTEKSHFSAVAQVPEQQAKQVESLLEMTQKSLNAGASDVK